MSRSTGTNVPSLDALAERVRVAQQELRGAANEFSKLKPPREIEAPNRDVAEGLDAYADDLDRLRDAAAAGDAKRVAAFEQGIPENESVLKIEDAAEEMKAKDPPFAPIDESMPSEPTGGPARLAR